MIMIMNKVLVNLAQLSPLSIKKHQSSSIDASDIVSGLNDANDNDKLSFDEGDGGQ